MKKLFCTFITLLSTVAAFCQTTQNEEDSLMVWEDFVEWIEETNEEEDGVDEELMEQLYELHANPLDLNEIKKEDLMVLPFLNEEQIGEIVRYVEKNRPVVSLGELMFVNGLGQKAREMLRLFVTVEAKPSLKKDETEKLSLRELLKYGKNEAVWRSDIPFYRKAGYEKASAEVLKKSPNKVYRGDRFHHSFRYNFASMNHLLAGLSVEKDAGEKGVDYVSGYVMVKDLGIVKNAILGNYRISFGKGLAVNTSAKFGKMSMFSTMDRMDVGIARHSSTAEYGYFTGAAATLRLGAWEVSAFGSYQKTDGTFRSDSMGLTSLKTDGLHRTQLERSKKGNCSTTHLGGNIHWEHKALRLSTTFIVTHLSVPLLPKHNTASSIYRTYNAHGQDFFVSSLAYAYRFKSLTFSGETAFSHIERQNGVATLNSLRWRVNGSNVLTLVGRYYGAKFVSLNGKAFGENATPQNEEGIFLSWTSRSIKNVLLETYVDAMYFPWLKSQVSSSSYGFDGMLQASYSPSKRWNLLARYRLKTKQKDFVIERKGGNIKMLKYNTNHNVKLQLNLTLSSFLSLRTSATGSLVSFGANPNEKGFAIGEQIRWQNPQNKCRIDVGITYFNTDSYAARLYHYEPSHLYSFGSTAYSDKGIRAILVASLPLVKKSLFLNAKFGMTHYFNRSTIGTGLELINAHHREDLQVQLRWKF